MKGIILAGGSGTRLYPLTQIVNKQMLPVYDKPMIQYPLSILMLAGIKEVLIISTPEDIPRFKDFLSNGKQLGMTIEYAVQEQPNGLAEAFIIGEEFIGSDDVCLILGDNVFHAHDFTKYLKGTVKQIEKEKGATVIGYWVKDPERYGVVELNAEDRAISIEEKPVDPKSNYAVVGLYFYDNNVVEIAKNLEPSPRGELEITDVNRIYMAKNQLYVKKMGRGFAWLDTGTHESLHDASNFVRTIEDRQGLKIACIEEIAYNNKWIDKNGLASLAEPLAKSQYGDYLLSILMGEM